MKDLPHRRDASRLDKVWPECLPDVLDCIHPDKINLKKLDHLSYPMLEDPNDPRRLRIEIWHLIRNPALLYLQLNLPVGRRAIRVEIIRSGKWAVERARLEVF